MEQKKRRNGQSGRFEKLTIEIFQPDTNPTFKSEVLSKSIEVENGERVNKKNKQRWKMLIFEFLTFLLSKRLTNFKTANWYFWTINEDNFGSDTFLRALLSLFHDRTFWVLFFLPRIPVISLQTLSQGARCKEMFDTKFFPPKIGRWWTTSNFYSCSFKSEVDQLAELSPFCSFILVSFWSSPNQLKTILAPK